jgi:hypothetical protein
MKACNVNMSNLSAVVRKGGWKLAALYWKSGKGDRIRITRAMRKFRSA